MPDMTQLFIDALHHLEDTGEVDQIAQLFREGADISNPLVKRVGEGATGAQSFWTAYRAAFKAIRSDFRNVVEGDRVTMLEWVSDGTTTAGPVRYGGVSVLEYDGDRISAFRSYFDPGQIAQNTGAETGALVQAQEEAAKRREEDGGYQ